MAGIASIRNSTNVLNLNIKLLDIDTTCAILQLLQKFCQPLHRRAPKSLLIIYTFYDRLKAIFIVHSYISDCLKDNFKILI